MLNELQFFGYQKIDNALGTIINKRLATLHELQTIYSLDDAMLLYDIILTNEANELKAENFIMKKNRDARIY